MSVFELLAPRKNWSDLQVVSLDALSVTADTLDVAELKTETLNLTNQLGPVPNPAAGSATVFTDSVGFLSTIDAVGDVDRVLVDDGSVPMDGDFDMNSNEIINVAAIRTVGGVSIGQAAAGNAGVAVGDNASAANNSSAAFGNDAVASGFGALALGRFSTCSVNNSLACGISSNNSGVGGIAIGRNTLNSGNDGISVGTSANCSSLNGVCIGAASSASSSGVAIGQGASQSGPSSVAIGPSATASGQQSVSIGNSSSSSGLQSTAIGRLANANSNGGSAFGFNSSAGVFGTALGRGANASGQNSACIGPDAVSSGLNSFSLGNSAVASNTSSLALGSTSVASALRSISIGEAANNSTANSCLIGDSAIVNIRPNNNDTCDLGVSSTNEFRDCLLSRKCLVGGDQVQSSKYSTYDDVSLSNQAVEADISSTVSSVGSLTFAPLELGAVLDFQFNFLVSSVAGDTVTFRYYTNAGLLFNHAIVYPALTVNEPGNIHSLISVRNGTIQLNSFQTVSGVVTMITSSAIVFDRTISNTFSITCECPASDVTNNQLFICSQFKSA